jgi:hypothetical protein
MREPDDTEDRGSSGRPPAIAGRIVKAAPNTAGGGVFNCPMCKLAESAGPTARKGRADLRVGHHLPPPHGHTERLRLDSTTRIRLQAKRAFRRCQSIRIWRCIVGFADRLIVRGPSTVNSRRIAFEHERSSTTVLADVPCRRPRTSPCLRLLDHEVDECPDTRGKQRAVRH